MNSDRKQSSTSQRLMLVVTTLSILSILSKVLGYGREAVFAAVFGASGTTDAYFVAVAVPTLLYSLVATVLETVGVPMYSRYLAREGERHLLREFLWTTFHLVLVLTFALGLGGYLLAQPLVRMMAPGFSPSTLAMAVSFTRMLVPIVMFLALSSWATGVLNAHEKFIGPALTGFPYNLILTGTALLVYWFSGNIFWLVIGTLLAAASQLVVQVPGIVHTVPAYQFRLNLRNPGLRQAASLAGPVVATDATYQLNNIVDRILASGLPSGSISALNYAQRGTALWQGMLSTPIITVLYPALAQRAAQADTAGFRRVLGRGLTLLALVMMPVSGGVIVFSKELVQLLYQRGAFSVDDTNRTALALLFYALGLVFAVWVNYLGRASYALQDARTPLLSSFAGVGVNILLNILIGNRSGIAGLAVATSIGSVVGAIVLLVLLRRKLGSIGGVRILLNFLKILLATASMVTTILFSQEFSASVVGCMFGTHSASMGGWKAHLLQWTIRAMLGGTVYLGACLVLGIDELREVGSTLRQLVRRLLPKRA